MLRNALYALLAAATPILGNPAPNPGNSGSSVCQRDILYLVFLNPLFNNAAVSFCSSYIHVPTATATVSMVRILILSTKEVSADGWLKINTAKAPTSTVVVTNIPTPSTVVITPVSTTTTYVATTTTTVYTTYTPDNNFKKDKRNYGPGGTPTFCNGYAANEISTACSCLSIPTSTKTVTATGTVTVPGAVSISFHINTLTSIVPKSAKKLTISQFSSAPPDHHTNRRGRQRSPRHHNRHTDLHDDRILHQHRDLLPPHPLRPRQFPKLHRLQRPAAQHPNAQHRRHLHPKLLSGMLPHAKLPLLLLQLWSMQLLRRHHPRGRSLQFRIQDGSLPLASQRGNQRSRARIGRAELWSLSGGFAVGSEWMSGTGDYRGGLSCWVSELILSRCYDLID